MGVDALRVQCVFFFFFFNIICALAYMFVHVCAAANEDDCA